MWAMGALLGLDIILRRRIDLDFLKRLADAISEGGRGVVTISAACAAAGIISGVLSMTGLGSKIAMLIDISSNGSLLLALILTMITSIILGMGLPTTAAYLILATVVAPALVKLGVPALTAHFFVFYYGCISTITPPVALAAYVAGGIAGADINKVGWTAAAYALTSFVLPFAFVYGPGLLLQGSLLANIAAIVTGFAGVAASAAAVTGCLFRPLDMALRLIVGAAGLAMLIQTPATGAIGLVVFVSLAVWNRRQSVPQHIT